MKDILIVLFLAVLLGTTVLSNNIFVSSSTDKIQGLAEELQSDASEEEKLDELIEFWLKTRPCFALSVAYTDIDYINEVMISLRASFESEKWEEFEQYRMILLGSLSRLNRFEKIEFSTVF